MVGDVPESCPICCLPTLERACATSSSARSGLDVSPVAIGAMTYGEPDRGHPVWSLRRGGQPPADQARAGRGHQLLRHRQPLLSRLQRGDPRPGAARLRQPGRRGDLHQGPASDAPRPQRPGLSRKAIMTEIDHSLRRLGTDYVDIYHDPPARQPHARSRRRWRRSTTSSRPARPATSAPRRCTPMSSPRLLHLQRAARLGAVRHHAAPLQPAGPRGGAGDAAAVRGRGRRHHRSGPRSPAAASPGRGTTPPRPGPPPTRSPTSSTRA